MHAYQSHYQVELPGLASKSLDGGFASGSIEHEGIRYELQYKKDGEWISYDYLVEASFPKSNNAGGRYLFYYYFYFLRIDKTVSNSEAKSANQQFKRSYL